MCVYLYIYMHTQIGGYNAVYMYIYVCVCVHTCLVFLNFVLCLFLLSSLRNNDNTCSLALRTSLLQWGTRVAWGSESRIRENNKKMSLKYMVMSKHKEVLKTDGEKPDHSYIAGRNSNCTVTLKKSLAVFFNIKLNTQLSQDSEVILWYLVKRNKLLHLYKTCKWIFTAVSVIMSPK